MILVLLFPNIAAAFNLKCRERVEHMLTLVLVNRILQCLVRDASLLDDRQHRWTHEESHR
jgi:hypothetical protein